MQLVVPGHIAPSGVNCDMRTGPPLKLVKRQGIREWRKGYVVTSLVRIHDQELRVFRDWRKMVPSSRWTRSRNFLAAVLGPQSLLLDECEEIITFQLKLRNLDVATASGHASIPYER